MNLPWVEKYRPQSLTDIIDNNDNIQTLKKMLSQGSLLHLLFYGPPGTGKTSTILAIARQLYGEHYRRFILELNASDERGIDTVRNKIPEFAKVACSTLRLIILDEADAMTTDAQNALRRVIEQYSEKCRFCLICNDVSAIIPGLQSRCAKLRFCNLNKKQLQSKLQYIVQQEGINISQSAIEYLADIKDDFRMILNTLQCLHTMKVHITPEVIDDYMGRISMKQFYQLLKIIKEQPVNRACRLIARKFTEERWSLESLIERLTDHLLSFTDEKYLEAQNRLITFLAKLESQMHTTNNQILQLYAIIINLQLERCFLSIPIPDLKTPENVNV